MSQQSQLQLNLKKEKKKTEQKGEWQLAQNTLQQDGNIFYESAVGFLGTVSYEGFYSKK